MMPLATHATIVKFASRWRTRDTTLGRNVVLLASKCRCLLPQGEQRRAGSCIAIIYVSNRVTLLYHALVSAGVCVAPIRLVQLVVFTQWDIYGNELLTVKWHNKKQLYQIMAASNGQAIKKQG